MTGRRLIQAVYVLGAFGWIWTGIGVVTLVWPHDWWAAICAALAFFVVAFAALFCAFGEVRWIRA